MEFGLIPVMLDVKESFGSSLAQEQCAVMLLTAIVLWPTIGKLMLMVTSIVFSLTDYKMVCLFSLTVAGLLISIV